MQTTTGSFSRLKLHRDAFASAYKELSEKLKKGAPGDFEYVDVSRTDANGKRTVERYGDDCEQPSKKAAKKESASETPTTPYHIFASAPFGARAAFSNAFGGTVAYTELAGKLKLKPKTNQDQSVVCHYFKKYMNKLEKDKIVLGSTAADLLPGFKTFTAFVEKAKALLAGGDDDAEEAGEAEEADAEDEAAV